MIESKTPGLLRRDVAPSILRMLAAYMRFTRTWDDGAAHVMGHPQSRVDWWRFVRALVRSGVEVSKEITASSRNPVFVWHLTATRQDDFREAHKRVSRPGDPSTEPPLVSRVEAVGGPRKEGFDDVMDLMAVESLGDGECAIFGLPKGEPGFGVPWKDVVAGLLSSEGVLGVARVYFVDQRDEQVKYAWRVVCREELDPKAIVGMKRKKEEPRVVQTAQPSRIVETEAERERIEQATTLYRQRWGMVEGPDGKWRVPLDPHGRVDKIVLFDPERACRVPGIDYSRTGPLTEKMLDVPRRRRGVEE